MFHKYSSGKKNSGSGFTKEIRAMKLSKSQSYETVAVLISWYGIPIPI
jgi:hypothetical protein